MRVSIPSFIRAHAMKYASVLREQIELYGPHLVLGCGVGNDSPAALLAAHVVSGGRERLTSRHGATWWEFTSRARPRAIVQLWHPAWRGKRRTLYLDVCDSVQDVCDALRLRR